MVHIDHDYLIVQRGSIVDRRRFGCPGQQLVINYSYFFTSSFLESIQVILDFAYDRDMELHYLFRLPARDQRVLAREGNSLPAVSLTPPPREVREDDFDD